MAPGSEGLVTFLPLVRPAADQGGGDGGSPGGGLVLFQAVDPPARELPNIPGLEIAPGEQVLGINEPGIQGRTAGGAVGRTRPVGGGQGKNLPDIDPMPGEQLDPPARRRAHGAAGGGARQGRRVEQDAAGPRRAFGGVRGGTHGRGSR